MSARRDPGFSLVEMLAALAVLSLAGLALMNAVTSAVRSAIHARERALAAIAAENVLTLALIEAHPLRGIEDDRGSYELAGTAYEWTIEVEDTPDAALRRVTLTLSDARGPVSELVTFRRRAS